MYISIPISYKGLSAASLHEREDKL